jgi:DNA-binding GntR family transcriptional regulator
LPLNTSVLADYAYSEILKMILAGEIEPGSRIREDFLAEQLGISRTPVREAVNRLTQNGFITIIKRKGLYCVKFTRQDLLNLLELRIGLESLSFEKCIDLATSEDIDAIQNTIDDFNKQFDIILTHNEENIVRELALIHNECDVRFHVGIARISNSARLIQYVTEVETMLLIARQRIYRSDERIKIVRLSWTQHQQMVESIRLRNKEAALALLEEHLNLMLETQVNIEYSDKTAGQLVSEMPVND